MASTIAEHFRDELTEWKRTIASHLAEIDELTMKLAAVVRRNSIPGIAAKVEKEQDKLNWMLKNFRCSLLNSDYRNQRLKQTAC